MKDNIDVSIVVPIYNEERYLKECVQSIVRQTYRNIEVILVDDGSTNSAAEICDELAAQDKRIVTIHKKNEGLSAARVTGLENASGKWIMFVDDDDIISPNTIQELLDKAVDGIDIVACQRIDLEKTTNYLWEQSGNVEFKILNGNDVVELIPEDNQKNIITPMWGKIYRKEFLIQQNILEYRDICPTIFFEDVLMTPIIYSMARKICIIQKVLYIHREVKTSISRSGKLSSFYFEQIESGAILLEYCKKRNLTKYYAYELGIYFRTILRIWCLLDTVDMQESKRHEYKEKIITEYYKYYNDYMKVGTDKIYIKLCYKCFKLNKNVWGKIIRKIYFQS